MNERELLLVNQEAFTLAQKSISTDHDYIHQGKGFSFSYKKSLINTAKLGVLFKTPAASLGKYLHLRPLSFSSTAGLVTVRAAEGGTFVKPNGTKVSGATQNMTFEAFESPVAIENQNNDGSAIVVNSVTGSVTGALVENTDFEVVDTDGVYGIQLLESGGTLVEGETQDMNFDAYSEHQDIENQNWDGGVITVNSVTGSVDGTLTLTDDYTVSLSAGKYGITLVEGTNITTLEQTFTVDYDYTPIKIDTFEQTFAVNYDYTPAKTPEVCRNRNRNKKSSLSSIDGVYIDPTESVAGTTLFETSIGSGSSPSSRMGGSVTGENDEWVLEPDQWYYVEIANNSGTTTVAYINLFFYEESVG